MRSTDLSRGGFIAGLAAMGAASASVAEGSLAGAAQSTAAGQLRHAAISGVGARTKFSARSSDGVVLAAEAQGHAGGPEILFVHGVRQSGLIWDRQFADATLTKFRLVRFDLRGHGDSDKPSSLAAYSDIERWGDDVAAVIAAARLRRPVVVAWSLGGAVLGGYLARRGGGQLAGVNLVDAVTKPTVELLTPLSGEFTRRTSSHDLAERSAATVEFFRACFEKPPRGPELEAMLVVNGMTARAATEGLALAKFDLDPAFRAFRGPLLLSHGSLDRLVRVAMSRHNLTLHPSARLSLYPMTGHSPFYEDAPRFNRELSAFASASFARSAA